MTIKIWHKKTTVPLTVSRDPHYSVYYFKVPICNYTSKLNVNTCIQLLCYSITFTISVMFYISLREHIPGAFSGVDDNKRERKKKRKKKMIKEKHSFWRQLNVEKGIHNHNMLLTECVYYVLEGCRRYIPPVIIRPIFT